MSQFLVPKRLELYIQQKKIPPALLFVGSTAQKHSYTFALDLMGYTSTQPCIDIHQYMPEGTLWMHKVETIQNMMAQAALGPFESDYLCMILQRIDRMTEATATRLLKVLEEPPERTVFVLSADHIDGLLPTIVSRCHVIKVYAIQTPEEKAFKEKIIQLIHLQIRFETAQQIYDLLPTLIYERQQAIQWLLEALLEWFRDLYGQHYLKLNQKFYPEYQAHYAAINLYEVEDKIQQIHEAINVGVNLQACLESLVLFLEHKILAKS